MQVNPDDTLINEGIDFDEDQGRFLTRKWSFAQSNDRTTEKKKGVTKFDWKRERN